MHGSIILSENKKAAIIPVYSAEFKGAVGRMGSKVLDLTDRLGTKVVSELATAPFHGATMAKP